MQKLTKSTLITFHMKSNATHNSAKNENRNHNFSPVYSIDTNDTDHRAYSIITLMKMYEWRPLRVSCNHCKWALITQTGNTTMSVLKHWTI